jgi:hypothetical protein
MTRWLASVCRRWAVQLQRLAARLDPPAVPIVATTLTDDEPDELAWAQQACNRMELARVLHGALHRYSPRDTPAQN